MRLFLALLLGVVAVIVAVVLVKKRKAKAEAEGSDNKTTTGGSTGSTGGSSSSASYVNGVGNYPISKGSKNRHVADLQQFLNDRYSARLDVDGNWGAKTETAVKNANIATPISEESARQIGFYNYRNGGSSSISGGSSQSYINNDKATHSDSWFDTVADAIYDDIKGLTFNADYTHGILMNEIHTNVDLKKLVTAFSVRDNENLSQWISGETNLWSVQKYNNEFARRGITERL